MNYVVKTRRKGSTRAQKNGPPPFLIWKDRRAPAFGCLCSVLELYFFFGCLRVRTPIHSFGHSFSKYELKFLTFNSTCALLITNGQKHFVVQSFAFKNAVNWFPAHLTLITMQIWTNFFIQWYIALCETPENTCFLISKFSKNQPFL